MRKLNPLILAGLALACSQLFALESANAFEPNFTRYLSGHDLIRTLFRAFPNVRTLATQIGYECGTLGQNAQILGAAQAVSGEAISVTPGPAYLAWYRKCVNMAATEETMNTLQSPMVFEASGVASYVTPATFPRLEPHAQRYLPSSLMLIGKSAGPESYSQFFNRVRQSRWNTLDPAALRKEIVKHWVEQWAGIGVLKRESEFIGMLEAKLTSANPSLPEAAKKAVTAIMLQEELLMY
jgi:hypothetical protein